MKDRIIFKFESHINPLQPTFTLVFEDEEEISIFTLNNYCRTFASALGYGLESIDKCFSEPIDEEKRFKELTESLEKKKDEMINVTNTWTK